MAVPRIRTAVAAAGLVALVAACSSGGTGSAPSAAAPSSKYPNAVAVLGHSGATGFDSDTAQPGMIQTVDNDIQCDGSDGANYKPFADTLTAVLKKITTAAPKGKILIVSSPWATAPI